MSNYVGNEQTEAVIGSAQQKFAQSLKQYEQAQQQLQKLPEFLNEYTLKIAQAQTQLNQLSVDYNEKKRQFNVELELHKKQSIERIVTDYLAGEAKVAIKHAEYEQLKDNLATALKEREQEINKEVGKATGIAEAKAKRDAEVREAQYNAKEAENKAQITSLTKQVDTLTKEIESWKTQLNEERKASVDRAKASSVGSINVSSPGK